MIRIDNNSKQQLTPQHHCLSYTSSRHICTHIYTHIYLSYTTRPTPSGVAVAFKFLLGPLDSKSVHFLGHLIQLLLGFLKLFLKLHEGMVRLLLSTRLSLLTTVCLVDTAIIGVMGVCRATMFLTEFTVFLGCIFLLQEYHF